MPDSIEDQLAEVVFSQLNAVAYDWKRFDSEHVCYVIQASQGGPFKIGNAKCLSRRINSLQGGNPDLLKVRALFSGGHATEREFHRALGEHRLVGEWFSEKAIPLMCDLIRKDSRFLWGSPWTEEVYSPPSPTLAEVRSMMYRVALDPRVQQGLCEVLQNPRHKAYRDVVRMVGGQIRVQLADGKTP